MDLRSLLDPTPLGTIVAVLAFGYTILIGSRTVPEWLGERRKHSAEKAKQKSSPTSEATRPLAEVTSEDFISSILYSEDQRLTTVACSSDGECVAFGGFSHRVYALSLGLGSNQIEHGESHAGIVRSVNFGHSSHAIVSAADDGIVKVSYLGHKEVKVVGYHDGPVYSAIFHPTQELIASAGKDGMIRLWDLTRAPIHRFDSTAKRQGNIPPITALRNEKGAVFTIAFDKAGNALASVGADGSVLLWDLRSRSSRALNGFDSTVFSACFHPNGEYLAAGGADGVIRIWDLKTNKCRSLLGHSDTVRWLAFDPSGCFLASASKDKTVRVWEFESEASWVLEGHQDYVYGAAFHSSGNRIFSVAGDGTVRAWSVPSFDRK